MSKKTNKNPNSIVPDISDAAYIPSKNFNYDGTPLNPMNQNPGWNPAAFDSGRMTPLKAGDIYTGNRYKATLPGTDYEHMHGATQSGWAQAANGLMKGVNLTGTTVLGGFGTLYGVGKSIFTGKLSSIWDNEIMHGLDEWNKKVDEEWLPNYYTNQEKDAEWYEASNWATPNFLFDKLIKNSGFAVGAMISGNIANAGLMAVGTRIGTTAARLNQLAKAKEGFKTFSKILEPTSRAFSQGKNIEAAMILEKELTGVADVAGKAKALEQLAKTTNKFTSYADGFRRTAVAAYSSMGEANFEALQTSIEYKEKLVQEYINKNGVEPTGQDLANIEHRANQVGATSFAGNMALLGVTEWFQLPYLVGSSYRASKAAQSRFIRETGEIAFDETGKAIADRATTRFGRMYQGVKKDIKGLEMPGFTKYLLDPKEGVQELGQFALQVGAQNYYDKAYDTNEADMWVDGVLHGFFGYNEEGEGVGAFTSKEGMEGGVIGMITGGLMQARQKYASNKQIAANTTEFIESLNNAPAFRDAFKQRLKDANRGIALQKSNEQAVKEGNKLESKDIEHDLMFNYMYNKIKYGRFDMVKRDMQDLITMGSTQEGLDALKEQGLANKEDTVDSYRDRVNSLNAYMESISVMAENVQQVYGNAVVTDKDGNTKPAYNEEVLEKLTYASSKIADYDVRMPQLEADLQTKGLVDTVAINESFGDPKALEEAELEQIIKVEEALAKQEILPIEGQELVTKIKDYIELKERKSYFFKEYNDIISNPAKYEEMDSNIPTPEETPITVTTKKGDKEVMLGREYLLGTVVKYDKFGNEVYRAPSITILEQKEDNNLVIRDANGKVQEITPEQLEDYDLLDPKELEENKTANWYINHWNEYFTHKSIKHKKGDKKGKPIQGRIRLGKDKKSLFFMWKDDNGKVKSLQLERRHFVPNRAKGFSKPLIESVGELTVAQKKATEELMTEEGGLAPLTVIQDKRKNLISRLYEEFDQKAKKSQALIKSKQEQLNKIREDLTALRDKISQAKGDKRVKNAFRFKSETRKALQRATTLTNMERQLQREIASLEDQAGEIELVQLELINMSDSLQEYPEDTKEFMETLKFDIELLKEAAEKNAEQITAVTQLINSTKNAIKAAVRAVENLISQFESRYPDIPIVIGKRFYDKQKDTVLKEEIDEVLDAIEYTENEVVVPNEQRIKDLEEHLDIMVEQAKDIEKQARIKQAIIDKFEGVWEDYKLQKLEESVFMNNEELQDELEATHDTDGIPNVISEEGVDNYEPASKKDMFSVVGGTKPFSGYTNPLTGKKEEPREHHKRSNRFGFRYNGMANKDKIKGVVVNSETEAGLIDGLMEHLKGDSEVDPTQTLAFVMVTETPEGLKLVDEFGNIIEDKTDVLNKAVYQVFPALDKNGQLTAYYDGKRDSMFRESDEANVGELTEKYATWREEQLNKKTRSVPEKFSASFGIPQYNTYLDSQGREQRDYHETTTAHDAGLVDDTLLVSDNVLTVATTSESIQNGSVTFNTPLGRVFLRIPGGLAKVVNRRHTSKEAEAIYSVLYQLAKQGVDKKTMNTPEAKRMLKWLKSVSHWGIIKDQEGNVKDPGYSSIWFERKKVGNDTIPVLMFSKNRQGIPFTPAALKSNYNEILFILEKMYVNVDASRVNKDNYNAPYYQIIGVNSKGEPITRKWPNYQSYLLSNKAPDAQGNLTQSRKKEDIPLVTHYKKVTPENPTNRQGIYFVRNSAPEEMYVERKQKAATPKATKEASGATVDPKLPAVDETSTDDQIEDASPYTLDGVTDNIFSISTGDSVYFTFDLNKALELYNESPINFKNISDKLAFIKKLAGLQIFGYSASNDAIEKIKANNPSIKTDVQASLKIAIEIFNELSVEFTKAAIQSKQVNEPTERKPDLDGTTDNIIDVEGIGDVVYTLDLDKANAILAKMPKDALSKDKIHNFIQALWKQKAVDIKVDPKKVEAAVQQTGKSQIVILARITKAIVNEATPQLILSRIPSDSQVETEPKVEVKKETPVSEKDKLLKEKEAPKEEPKQEAPSGDSYADKIDYSQYTEEDEEDAMREVIEREAGQFQPENWREVEAWLKKNFPNIPVYRVKNMIQGTNGKQSWGMLHKGAIYLYEYAEIGTAYHEVFEAVWKMFTTPQERKVIIDEFRDRSGSYEDRFTGETIEYSKATVKQLKEEIAEEFRDKVLFGKSPKRNPGKNWISRMFNDLINFFKKFFVGEDALNNTRKLFAKIESGHYAKYSPYAHELSMAQMGIQDIDSAVGDATSEYRDPIRKIPAQQQHDIMQHMTFHVLKTLSKTNESLFHLPTLNRTEMYKELHDVIISKVARKIGARLAEIKKDSSKEEVYAADINNDKILINNINDQWDNIVAKHEELLQSYEITFDENDEMEVSNFEKDKHDPYGDATKIDTYRKASYAVKFLMSSLPYTNEKGKLIPSTIGGAQLIPSDKLTIDLRNKLYDSVDITQMFERLGELGLQDNNYANLYSRLLGNAPEKFPNFDKVDQMGWELIGGFWKLMKSQNPDVIAVFILPDGIQIGDSALAGAAKQSKKEMMGNITTKIKEGSDYFDYNPKNGRYKSSDKIKKVQLNKSAPEGYTAFLKHFDIDISPVHLTSRLNDHQRASFFEAVDGILLSMQNINNMVTISSKTLNIDGNMLRLGTVQAIIENPEFESTYYNINGEKSQTFIGTNPLSRLYDVIAKAGNIKDLVESNYNYLRTDSFAKGSVLLNKIFVLDGDGRRRNNTTEVLKPVYIDGTVDQVKGKKKQSSRLTYRQRVLQEINLNLDGVYMNLVPGDASLEWGVRMHNAKDPFVTEEQVVEGDFQDIFKDYFLSEIELIRENRITDRRHDNQELRFFKAILSSMDKKQYNAMMRKIRSKAKKKVAPEKIYEEYQSEIQSAIKRFIEAETKDVEALLNQFGVIQYTDEGINVAELNIDERFDIDINTLRNTLKTVSINYMIANIEMHKVLYSDPYQYSDELKRIKNFNSPRQPLIEVTKKIGKTLNRIYNAGFTNKNDIGFTDFTRNFFRTITFEDVWSHYNLPGFENEKTFEETDGAGIITLKAVRKYRILANDWNADHEAQYRYEVAWEKRDKGLKLSKKDKQALVDGNPKVMSTFTSMKPIVSGGKQNERNYNDIMLDKYALIVYSYRILKEINPDANAVSLYNKMTGEDIDYVVFNSARKVGAEKMLPLYDDKGNLNNEPFEKQEEINNPDVPQTIINVPFSIMSVQAEVPSKEEHKITRGSQITKLATLDYMEAGIPIDFFPEKSFEDRFIEWTKLEDKRSYQSSIEGATENLYTLIERNQEILEAKIELGYRALLKEFGIKQVGNTYVLENKTKLAKTLKKEMLRREINDNVSAAFDAFKEGDIVIEATPAYQQIRHILYSIADSRVVSPKIKGAMKVQIPVSLLESKKIEQVEINGKTAYVSDTLKFYEDEDGLRHCEIMLGRWFESDKTDEELLDSWYEKDKDGNRTTTLTEEGKKVLSGVAFRIPTQKQNSIDVFVIKKLLPKEYGDNVVVPSNIAKKAGSDFDIDKLSIYLKNVLVDDSTGEVSVVPYLDDSNSTPEERYNQYVKGEVKEYREIRREVQKDSIEWNELQKSINKAYEVFKSKINALKGEQIIPLSDSLDAIKENIDSNKEASEEVYNMGYEIFQELPAGIKDAFIEKNQIFNERIRRGKMEKYEKTLQFRSFAQDWITQLNKGAIKLEFTNRQGANVQQTVTKTAIPVLEALIGNYDLFLTSVGFTSETIKEFSSKLEELKDAKKEYRDVRHIERQSLDFAKSNIYKSFTEEFNKTLAEVFDLMSLEEFNSQSIDLQNNKQALENEYIDSLGKLISHPLNFDNLVKPNSAAQMKKLAKDLNTALGRPEIDYSSPGNMMSRRFMSGLRQAFVSGKYAIGIAAVNQTNHSLNQRTPIYVDLKKLAEGKIDPIDAHWLKDGKLKFQSFNRFYKDEDVTTTLSMIKNAAGDFISDIIGMFIDGYVDISAGPWIMEIGATPTTSSTWLFLIKAGVPIDDIVYFMNQPIIREYIQLLDNNGYSWLFIDTFRDLMVDQYTPAGQPINIEQIPSLDSLKETVNKPFDKMNEADKAAQVFMLNEFLKYSKMANHLFQVTQGSNFDTANFNDSFLIYKKGIQLENARNTIISSVDDILETSFIGKLAQKLSQVRDALSTVLISDRKSPRTNGVGTRMVLETVLRPYINASDREFLKISKRAVSDLFDWYMQTDTNLNEQVLDVLAGDNSAASEIMDFKKMVKNNPKHPLYNNIVINSIQLEPGTTLNRADNLYIARKDNKVYDQNLVINAFRELKEFLKVEKNGLYGKLVRLALLQSGITHSRISFTSLLPFEDFIDNYKMPLSQINNDDRIADFALLNVFQRNNWNNSDIVPFKRETMIPYQDQFTGRTKMFRPETQKIDKRFKQAMESGVLPKIVNISTLSMEGQHDVIVYNWEEVPAITDEDRQRGIKNLKAKKAWMRKNGDFSFSKKALLKKVYTVNEKGDPVPLVDPVPGKGDKVYDNYVYKAINAWGDGTRAQEMYGKMHPLDVESTLGQPSVLDNGFEKYNEVEDSLVLDVYNSEYIDMKSGTKDIAFTPANQQRILSGQKTTTIRNAFDLEGIINIQDRYFFIKRRGKFNVRDAGGAQNMVNSEALPTVKDKVNKFPVEVNGVTYYLAFESSQNFFKGTQEKWIYDITDVTDQYKEVNKNTPKEATATDPGNKADAPLTVNIYSTDKNGFQDLSNFSTKRPYTDSSGRKFATVEAAFQFAKTNFATGNNDAVKKQILKSTTGAQAKALGRKVKGLNTKLWDDNSRELMKRIIKDSFRQNPGQLPLLFKTGDAIITHLGGPKSDKWTTLFPQIMMEVRNELTLEFDSKINKPPGLPGIDRSNGNC